MKRELAPETNADQAQAIRAFTEHLRHSKGDQILATFLIGSVARGDFGPDSDIDIVVVARDVDTGFKCDVWDLGADVSLEHNVILNVHIYSRERWDKMRHERTLIWQNIQRESVDLSPEPA